MCEGGGRGGEGRAFNYTLVHDDVAKSIMVMELQRAKEEWMCHTLHELYDEMELWWCDSVQHNRWARTLKASNQVKVRPMWYVEDTEHEGKRLSWATATSQLAPKTHNIVAHSARRLCSPVPLVISITEIQVSSGDPTGHLVGSP